MADDDSPNVERIKRPIESANKRSVVISFRVTEADMEPYNDAIKSSGKSRSVFFYQLFIEQKSRIVIAERPKRTEDFAKYLFFVNKMSNNLNQLARLMNGLYKSGRLSETRIASALNQLNSIRLILNNRLNRDN